MRKITRVGHTGQFHSGDLDKNAVFNASLLQCFKRNILPYEFHAALVYLAQMIINNKNEKNRLHEVMSFNIKKVFAKYIVGGDFLDVGNFNHIFQSSLDVIVIVSENLALAKNYKMPIVLYIAHIFDVFRFSSQYNSYFYDRFLLDNRLWYEKKSNIRSILLKSDLENTLSDINLLIRLINFSDRLPVLIKLRKGFFGKHCKDEDTFWFYKTHIYFVNSAYSKQEAHQIVLEEYEKTTIIRDSTQSRVTISKSVKRLVFHRDSGQCVKCGSKQNLEYDHVIPVSKGGSSTERNIQLLCLSCNRSKGANIE